MKTRVITSVVWLCVLALVLCFFNTLVFNAALVAVVLIAFHEIYNAFALKCPAVYVGLIPVTLLLFLYGETAVRQPLFWAVLYVTVLFLAACTVLFFHRLNYAKLAGTVLFCTVVVVCFYAMLYLRAGFPRPSAAVYFIILGLGFAWGGDTSAYFAGRAFGKHKLAPEVSPHKTIEGAVGGILGSILVGMLITAVYVALYGAPDSTVVDVKYYLLLVPVGAIGSMLGILGDLFASAVKRQCGIKDYGTIFPGHGGILDRFDSVLLIIPYVALCASFLVGV